MDEKWKATQIEGIVFVILGILILIFPTTSAITFDIFLGWLFILGGAMQLFLLPERKKPTSIIVKILKALIFIGAGCFLLIDPTGGVITLALLLSIFFYIEGAAKIILSFHLRDRKWWSWLFCSGILSLIIATLIIWKWPSDSAWFLSFIIGINLIFYGIAEILLSNRGKITHQ